MAIGSQRIIITGAFRFPDGDAAAARVLSLGKCLRDGGYDACFAGWEDAGRQQDLQADGTYLYEGFRYDSQADLRTKRLSPAKRLVRYLLAGTNTLRWLASIDLTDVKAIIAYHGGSIFLIRLRRFCRSRGIRFLFDCTEWYDARNQVGGRFGLAALDDRVRMRLVNPAIGAGIVVSTYLERYYNGRKCRVLRVPPLVDLDEKKWREAVHNRASGALRLVYAGTPGKKDLLGNALKGLKLAKDEGYDVVLDIVGPARAAILESLGDERTLLDELGDAVVIHGRVPQQVVPSLLATADYSVLLRPQRRYAQAGFSTKLVESLAAAVPAIVNKTSDIGDFVRDGIEGILLDDESPEAFARGLKRALAIPGEQRRVMRKAARTMARRSLDYRVYTQRLCLFVRSEITASDRL